MGRKANGALAIKLTISDNPVICGNISTNDLGPNIPCPVKMLFKAINKPPATKAGINGTKMSDNTLIKSINGFFLPDFAAMFFKSSVDACFTPVNFTNSS